MAKQRASQQKREREAAKRDREFKKRNKAAKRRERREGGGVKNDVVTPEVFPSDEPANDISTTDPPQNEPPTA